MTRTPIDPALFERKVFHGWPPHAPYARGWSVALGGLATKTERIWLKAHGYAFAGGRWYREDRRRSASEAA